MSDRYQVIEKVEDYWRQAGLASSDVAEMKAELHQHLVDAEVEGVSVTDVVGDTALFAETWARGPSRPTGRRLDRCSEWIYKDTARISKGPSPVWSRDRGGSSRRSRKRTRRYQRGQ